MRKCIFILSCCFVSLQLYAADVYHGGQAAPRPVSFPRWEVSAGWIYSDLALEDRVEEMFTGQGGFTARALFYPLRWLAVGAEGSWFNQKNFYQISYQENRQGLLTKWLLTPDTKPTLYVLLGAGKRHQELTYAQASLAKFNRREHSYYGLCGLGLTIPVYGVFSVEAEGHLVYMGHQKIDKFFQQAHRYERAVSLRGVLHF